MKYWTMRRRYNRPSNPATQRIILKIVRFLLTIRSYFFFFFPSVHSANAIYKSALCFVLDLGQIQWKIQGSFCLKKKSIRRWLSKNSFDFPLFIRKNMKYVCTNVIVISNIKKLCFVEFILHSFSHENSLAILVSVFEIWWIQSKWHFLLR